MGLRRLLGGHRHWARLSSGGNLFRCRAANGNPLTCIAPVATCRSQGSGMDSCRSGGRVEEARDEILTLWDRAGIARIIWAGMGEYRDSKGHPRSLLGSPARAGSRDNTPASSRRQNTPETRQALPHNHRRRIAAANEAPITGRDSTPPLDSKNRRQPLPFIPSSRYRLQRSALRLAV